MNIEEAYKSVKDFNAIAGNLTDVDDLSIALQLDLIQEEYIEGVEAFDAGDKVELLDAAVDMWIVVSGLLHKLESQGYDTAKAIQKVTDNNMSKYIKAIEKSIWPTEYKSMYNKEYGVIVLRNKDNKIMKPPGFKPVDLSDCVPGDAHV